MRKAFMKTLDLEVPLKKNEIYVDEGFVPNVLSRIIEIEKGFNVKIISYEDDSLTLTKGYTAEFKRGVWPFKKRNVHIFYVNQENNVRNIFTMGHEETHAIEKFNNLENLIKKINKYFKLRLSFEDLRGMNPEFKANLGGIYSLLKKGYSAEQIKSEFYSSDENIFDPSFCLNFFY